MISSAALPAGLPDVRRSDGAHVGHARNLRGALTLAVLLLQGACASHVGIDAEQLQARKFKAADGVAYERLAAERYSPEDWPESLNATVYRPTQAGIYPAVLVVHGGGWARRSPADMERISRVLASRGFVAVNVAYRLAPAYTFPAPLEDLQLALDWMEAHAERLQIDPARIGAFGYSAGAHLVSLLAVLESSGHPQWVPARRTHQLRAVVAGGIPADLTQWPKSPLVKQFLGETYKANPVRWGEASPITHVSPSSPPHFLYHGGFDQLVEIEQSRAMAAKLQEAGVQFELYTVPYHGHLSMFLLNRSAVRRGTAFLLEHL